MGTPYLRPRNRWSSASSGHALALMLGLVVGMLSVGCGGSQDGPPGPLSRHFDDTFLAQIPLDQRKDEIAAKQAYDIASLEKAKAAADYNESRVQLDVAKNERDAARLDEKSAKTRQKAATDSADMNRVKEADKEVKAATAAKEAAEKRYDYINAYRTWLKKLMRFTEHNAFWKEAQYELAQAKLAQSNNIQPKGFVFDDYVKQEADRQRKVTDAKQKAEREKQLAMSARSKWTAIQNEADKLLGKKSEFPDPMAPNQVKGTDQSAGAGGYTIGNDSGSGADTTQPVQDPTMNGGGGDDDDDDGDGGGDSGGADSP